MAGGHCLTVTVAELHAHSGFKHRMERLGEAPHQDLRDG